MKKILKKIIRFISLIVLIMPLVGCAGLGDYKIKLFNDYEIIRISAECVYLTKEETDWNEFLVPIYYDGLTEEHSEYVTEAGHDSKRYIVVKTSKDLYYIVDDKESKIYDNLSKNEFDKKKEEFGISDDIVLKSLDDYEKIR